MPSKVKTGYTTGACAAAAAKGVALALTTGREVRAVNIALPDGEKTTLPIQGCVIGDRWARCCVVKDAGDDPDVTHGAEIAATIWMGEEVPPEVGRLKGEGFRFTLPPFTGEQRGGNLDRSLFVEGGEGVGLVTKPGLPVEVGRPAINPVPLRMIVQEVEQVLRDHRSFSPGTSLRVAVTIPRGETLASHTLNRRLGIQGGLSILGTTGIVHPISHAAWQDTLSCALDVALACGCREVVLSTGRISERAAQSVLELPPEAHILMGDQVGFALQACARKGVKKVTLAGQLGKLTKVAAGHLSTHCREAEMDWSWFGTWAESQGIPGAAERLRRVNTGRALAEIVIEEGWEKLFPLLCRHVQEQCRALIGNQARVSVLLVGYREEVWAWARSS